MHAVYQIAGKNKHQESEHQQSCINNRAPQQKALQN
jgi:hypothetical protein